MQLGNTEKCITLKTSSYDLSSDIDTGYCLIVVKFVNYAYYKWLCFESGRYAEAI